MSDDRVDDAALQFLLQQSLLARAEEEKAREEVEVRLLEERVVVKEQYLVEELNQLGRLNDRTNLAQLLGRACGWALARKDLLAMKEKREAKRKLKKKRRKRRRRAWSSSWRVARWLGVA